MHLKTYIERSWKGKREMGKQGGWYHQDPPPFEGVDFVSLRIQASSMNVLVPAVDCRLAKVDNDNKRDYFSGQ